MKSTVPSIVFAIVFCAMTCLLSFSSTTMAFTPGPSSNFGAVSTKTASTTTTQLFIFGQPKDDGKPGDYKCPDCDYVFTKGPKAWAELPNDWSCPPCGAPKRRFKKVPKGSASPSKPAPKKGGFFGK
mmetsp:Transcript_33810/g.81355  ORF Transcript_33810/g.81355 Transcript_33810/m.81355 type:complete len:127 (+) Transcript_33810:103-483(+)